MNEIEYLMPDDRFRFACSEQVLCFNECCRDLNQFLTPYDILRLKNGLKLSSSEFLDQYTLQHTGPQTGFPVITLKAADRKELRCPFVTPGGCSVYEHRPSSCRIYPLIRLVSRSRETGKISEQYAIIQEDHCKGFEENRSQTVREWISSQELAEYHEMNDLMMEIIALKNQYHPEPLDMKSRHIFHLALYDLDNFRQQIFENGLLDQFGLNDEMFRLIRKDDVELLKIGFQWVRKVLFF